MIKKTMVVLATLSLGLVAACGGTTANNGTGNAAANSATNAAK